MAKKRHLVVYLEDDGSDREEYKRRLEADGRISVEAEIPSERIEPEIITNHNPSLAIIDYRLDTKQRSGRSATYKGSSFAVALREREPDMPIVLLSRGTILRQSRYKAVHDVLGAYDELLLKEDILKDAREVVGKLIDIIDGFKKLSQIKKKDWKSLLLALGAKEEEYSDLLRANPPRDLKWRVPEAARWVRTVILRYPGLLYDSIHAAAALGIEKEAFLSTPVQRAFVESRYNGVFAEEGSRWWKRRLLSIAYAIMDKADMLGNPATKFSKAWKKRKRRNLLPSKCIVSDTPHADLVCFVLLKPVMREFSLPYLPDERPPVMDEARLSFKAIKETNEYDEKFVREDARPLVRRIQRGEFKY